MSGLSLAVALAAEVGREVCQHAADLRKVRAVGRVLREAGDGEHGEREGAVPREVREAGVAHDATAAVDVVRRRAVEALPHDDACIRALVRRRQAVARVSTATACVSHR